MIITKTLNITIDNEDIDARAEQYKFIRDSQYAQYRGLNRAMSFLGVKYLSGDKEHFKEAKKQLTNSSEFFNEIAFGKGIDSKSHITQTVKKDLQADIKNGLAKGDRSIRNYKRTYPLMTRGRDLKFSYEEESIMVKWVNKTKFKVLLGRKDKDYLELMHTLNKVITGEYKVCTSKLKFDNNKLVLILTLDITKAGASERKEGRILGVDLGIKVPVFACVSDNTYTRMSIGSIEEFLKVRMQFDKRRRRVQQQLQNVKGGKGRKDKLQALDRMRASERNWVRTYNHALSKRVVEFAIKNRCSVIQLEKLTKEGFNNRLLRNWSYYELQNMIEYKAKLGGLLVKYIDPAYTSQMCSRCAYTDKENRENQERFICKRCGFELNADHNAAINIARSIQYVI